MTTTTASTELEIRLAFLEDQLDQLSAELAQQQRHSARLADELILLTRLIKPMIDQSNPNAPTHLDQEPPPHY